MTVLRSMNTGGTRVRKPAAGPSSKNAFNRPLPRQTPKSGAAARRAVSLHLAEKQVSHCFDKAYVIALKWASVRSRCRIIQDHTHISNIPRTIPPVYIHFTSCLFSRACFTLNKTNQPFPEASGRKPPSHDLSVKGGAEPGHQPDPTHQPDTAGQPCQTEEQWFWVRSRWSFSTRPSSGENSSCDLKFGIKLIASTYYVYLPASVQNFLD